MFCKECGKEIDENSKYCSLCGAKQPEKVKPKPLVTEKLKEERAKPVVAEKAKEETIKHAVAVQSIAEEYQSGYVVTDGCVNCGSCDSECSVSAISEKNGKRYIDHAVCVSCGACSGACPTESIVYND